VRVGYSPQNEIPPGKRHLLDTSYPGYEPTVRVGYSPQNEMSPRKRNTQGMNPP